MTVLLIQINPFPFQGGTIQEPQHDAESHPFRRSPQRQPPGTISVSTRHFKWIDSVFPFKFQAALAESNLNFLHRQSSTSQSPLDARFHHHLLHHHGQAGLDEPHHHSGGKRVKLEAADDESSSTNGNAKAAEDFYGRNPAGGSSLGVIKPSGGSRTHETSSGTDNEADHNDASSTENYEPLDFKAWRSQRPANDVDDDEDDEDDDGDSYARASLTVELGPASGNRLKVDGPSAGSDYMTQTVHSSAK